MFFCCCWGGGARNAHFTLLHANTPYMLTVSAPTSRLTIKLNSAIEIRDELLKCVSFKVKVPPPPIKPLRVQPSPPCYRRSFAGMEGLCAKKKKKHEPSRFQILSLFLRVVRFYPREEPEAGRGPQDKRVSLGVTKTLNRAGEGWTLSRLCQQTASFSHQWGWRDTSGGSCERFRDPAWQPGFQATSKWHFPRVHNRSRWPK